MSDSPAETPKIIVNPDTSPPNPGGAIIIGPNIIPSSQLTETMVQKHEPSLSDLNLEGAVKHAND